MKPLHVFVVIVSILVVTIAQAAPREVKIFAEKKGEATHWSPEKVEVTQGEDVVFKVSHDLPEGFAFHGFKIGALKIEKSVDRGKPVEVPAKITLKPGEYDIGCQFHPKHVPAKLVVKAAPKKTNSEPVSPIKPPKG